MDIISEELILEDQLSKEKQNNAEPSTMQERIVKGLGIYNEEKLMNALISMNNQVK